MNFNVKVLLGIFVTIIFVNVGNATMKSGIVVHGHRGARGVLPENTLVAFEYALETGVDYLEFDLNVTKDGVLVITHDPILNKNLCLDENGNNISSSIAVNSLNFSELQKFDCGSLKNSRFSRQTQKPGEKIPSLEQFFKFIKNSNHPSAKTVKFNIELKYESKKKDLYPDPEKYVNLLLDLLEKEKMTDRSLVQSFEHDLLVLVKKRNPKMEIAALQERPKKGLLGHVEKIGAEYLSPNYRWVDAKLVADFAQKGIKVVPWTANKPSQWKKLKESGVHGIISDYPKELTEWLKKNP